MVQKIDVVLVTSDYYYNTTEEEVQIELEYEYVPIPTVTERVISLYKSMFYTYI